MADQESLSKNMDKISYAAAAVLGVAVLAVPLFSGGGLEGSVRDLKKKRDEVERRIDIGPDEGDPGGGEIDVITKIEGQWSTRPGRASVSWATERMQIRKTITARVVRGSAKHLAGRVEAISFERDPEKTKPFILVNGSMSPENFGIMLRRVTLYRSVGDDDPVPVSGFKADVEPNGSFTYADYDIEPGDTYTYSFASFAESADPENLILAPEQREARSGPLGPSPAVPYDYKFAVLVFQAEDDPPAVRATASWWDYEKGELGMIKKTKTFVEKETFGPGGRWRIRRVNQKYVQIKDSLTLLSEKISTKDGRRSVEAWEPILAAAPVDEAAQEEEAPTRREKSPRARSATAIALEEARRRRAAAAAADESAQETEEAPTRREKSPRARSATAVALEEARRRRAAAAAAVDESAQETEEAAAREKSQRARLSRLEKNMARVLDELAGLRGLTVKSPESVLDTHQARVDENRARAQEELARAYANQAVAEAQLADRRRSKAAPYDLRAEMEKLKASLAQTRAELEREKKINEELRRKLKKLAPDTDFSASDEEFDEGFDEQTATTERIRRYEKAFRAQAEIPDVLARLGKLTEHFQSAGLRPKAESVDLSNRTGTLQADCRLELRADGWGRIKKALDGVRELLPAARILKLEVAAQDGAVLATVDFRTGKGGPRSSAAFLAPLTALLEAAPELASEDWKLEAVATSSRCEVEYHAADITLEVLTTLLERLAQSGNTLAHHVTIRQATTGKGASVKIRLEARNDASKARR